MSAVKLTHADILHHICSCTICQAHNVVDKLSEGKDDNYLQLAAMKAHLS